VNRDQRLRNVFRYRLHSPMLCREYERLYCKLKQVVMSLGTVPSSKTSAIVDFVRRDATWKVESATKRLTVGKREGQEQIGNHPRALGIQQIYDRVPLRGSQYAPHRNKN
jgi:hypothetical protein